MTCIYIYIYTHIVIRSDTHRINVSYERYLYSALAAQTGVRFQDGGGGPSARFEYKFTGPDRPSAATVAIF